jgi:hypothetical protein
MLGVLGFLDALTLSPSAELEGIVPLLLWVAAAPLVLVGLFLTLGPGRAGFRAWALASGLGFVGFAVGGAIEAPPDERLVALIFAPLRSVGVSRSSLVGLALGALVGLSIARWRGGGLPRDAAAPDPAAQRALTLAGCVALLVGLAGFLGWGSLGFGGLAFGATTLLGSPRVRRSPAGAALAALAGALLAAYLWGSAITAAALWRDSAGVFVIAVGAVAGVVAWALLRDVPPARTGRAGVALLALAIVAILLGGLAPRALVDPASLIFGVGLLACAALAAWRGAAAGPVCAMAGAEVAMRLLPGGLTGTVLFGNLVLAVGAGLAVGNLLAIPAPVQHEIVEVIGS